MGNSLEVIFWIIFLWFILYVHVFKVGLGKLDFFWQLEKMYNIQWWTEEEEGNAHFYFFTTFVFLSLNCLTTSILMCRIHYVQNSIINFSSYQKNETITATDFLRIAHHSSNKPVQYQYRYSLIQTHLSCMGLFPTYVRMHTRIW